MDTKATQAFPIAVIGVACRFPGAPDLEAFAGLLARGGDAVTSIPRERWTHEMFLHPDGRQPGKSYTMAAGVIDGVDRFDAAFFGISPREAVQMDPQQRLLLELTYEAFEDAGVPGRAMGGTRTGVFVGGSASDYMALRLSDMAVADAYFMTGSTLSTLSNRISYVFDLKGPSFTVDTACSSSLVALHLACTAMRRGEADMAVVGGVNLLLSPQSFVGFSRASMLSPRGRCHAFADGADGYVRAEGGGVLLLKPLEAALADGDPIRFVIEGTGVNSDGRTAGLSLPSGTAQAALLRDVYGASRVGPEDLVYMEAHGTGTAVGDPIEAGALGSVLGQGRMAPLPVGSVKSNIGHLEAASGMAGLLKAMLVLRDGTIPASLHSAVPNPAIDFEGLNLRLAQESMSAGPGGARPGGALRAAGVNSFGFGGTNAHAVISAAPALAPALPSAVEVEAGLPPLLVSARSPGALAALAGAWRGRLNGLGNAAAAPLLRAAARHREQHGHRLAVAGDGTADLVRALDAFAAKQESAELASGIALSGGAGVCFVYSGNGSQWAGMGLDALGNPVFRRAMEEVDSELAQLLGWSVTDRLRTVDAAGMRATDVAQPLLFAVQFACTRVLAGMGVRATAHVGHSVGEVAAAAAAGALSLQDAAQVIAARSAAQQRTAHQGRMAVLALGADAAVGLLDLVPGVEVAAVNSTASITVAGPAAALERLGRLAAKRRVAFVPLDLDYAFHSAAMDPIREELLLDLAGIRPRAATEAFYSTVFGRAHDGTGLGPEYWWQNVRAPVRFAEAMGAALAGGCNILLEIGPNPVLQSYLRDALKHADHPGVVMPTLSQRHKGGEPFRRIGLGLHVAGHDISGSAVFDGPTVPDGLPRYPWQKERYWYERTDEATDAVAATRDHPLLGFRRGAAPGLWFNTLDTAVEPWLADHAVDGAALLPATAIVEMALAAARALHPEAGHLDVLDLEITRPLLLEAEAARETRFGVSGERGVFELASRNRLAGEAWTVHATGRVAAGSGAPMPVVVEDDEDGAVVPAGEHYRLTALLGLQYGPAFQTVERVELLGDRGAAVRLVADDGVRLGQGFLTDPARTDGALQGLVSLAARQMDTGSGALLPWRIGRVRLVREAGAVASARLRVTRIGPRSVSAEVALLDADGAVVGSFGDCWFTRTAGSVAETLDEALFHTVSVPMPHPGTPVLRPLPKIVAQAGVGTDDAALLTEAYAAAAACAAIRPLADAEGRVDPAALVTGGRVHADALPLLRTMLGWLVQDGMASGEAGVWTLAADEDSPGAAEIWQSILADAPTAVAEAALIGTVGRALPAILARGLAALPRGLGPLTRQMLVGSPTGLAVSALLADAVGELAETWPPHRRLRVLELNAAQDGATPGLVRALVQAGARVGREVEYVAAVPPLADAGALVLSALPGAVAVEWDAAGVAEVPAVIGVGSFDLVVGAMAFTRGTDGEALARVQGLMAPGGLLLLAEARPNRAWDLRFGADPSWWRPDGTGCVLREDREWLRALHGAGFGEGSAVAVGPAVWSVNALTARAHGSVPAGAVATRGDAGLLLLSNQGDALAAAVAETMLTAGRASLAVGLDKVGEVLRTALPLDGDLVFVVPEARGSEAVMRGVAEAGSALGAWAAALAETTGLRLWVVVRAGADDDGMAASLRGVTRVLANEAPNLRPFFVQLDAGLAVEEAASLLAREIAAPGAETEITLGADRRAVPRLRRGMGPRRVAAPGGDARLAIGRAGLLDTLRWERMETRAPGANEVGIAVAASGLNFRDVMWALGLLPDEALMDGLAGATLGLECAGTVTAVGAGVEGLSVGDRVMAIAPACLATAVVAPAQAVVRLPDGMDMASAATVPVAFLTVCYALGTLANIQPGERVLIHGGAGGVGLAAIQYARHRGAEIFASAGSPAKRAVLGLLGVEHILDSRSLDFADEVMARTGGQGIDVVLNSLAGEAMERSVGVLRPFGRFLELGKRDLYGNTPLGLRALRHNVSYFAIDADQLPVQRPDVARRVFAEIGELMAAGALRPLPHRVFGAGAATDAFRLMQSAGHVGKIVLRPDAAEIALPPAVVPWAPSVDGTMLVTGGLGGFGLATARWLAGRGVRSLALLGRRGAATPGAEAALAEFAAQGVDARAYACDVSDPVGLAAVLAEIRAGQAPLRGVVHAAMVLDDALMPQLTPERFERVLQPKLAGGLLLDRLTRQDALDTFLLFSSITTTLGNPGQANYVAANAGLEALAARRRAAGLPGQSVGWGPIADVGYLARETAVSEALAARMGGAHLRSDQALDLLPVLLAKGLASGAAHVDVAQLRWSAMRAHLPHLATPIFAEVSGGEQHEGGQIDLVTLLADSTPEEARALVGNILAEEVSAITKTPNQQIDLGRSLTEMGMDSLMAVELRMALERRLGSNLPLLSLADGASIGSIAGRIVRQLSAAKGGAKEGVNLVARSDVASAMLDRFEESGDEPGDEELESGLGGGVPQGPEPVSGRIA